MLCSGFTIFLSVLHQSFGPIFGFSNFEANCLISSDLDLRIAFVTLFLVCLYFSKSLILCVCLYVSYKRFFFLINCLISFASHVRLFRTILVDEVEISVINHFKQPVISIPSKIQ